jgi:1,4-dihydroxy-2-naphthoate octaprenyltransferase
VSLLPAAMSARAARDILKFATEPHRLVPAIQMTIGAASVHGLLLALALACARLLT